MHRKAITCWFTQLLAILDCRVQTDFVAATAFSRIPSFVNSNGYQPSKVAVHWTWNQYPIKNGFAVLLERGCWDIKSD